RDRGAARRLCTAAGRGAGGAGGDRGGDAAAVARLFRIRTPPTRRSRAMTAMALALRSAAKRHRELVTPEGLALPLTIASRSARAGALLLDLALLLFGFLLLAIALGLVGIGLLDQASENLAPAAELVLILMILLMFLARYGYFLWFELGPRG